MALSAYVAGVVFITVLRSAGIVLDVHIVVHALTVPSATASSSTAASTEGAGSTKTVIIPVSVPLVLVKGIVVLVLVLVLVLEQLVLQVTQQLSQVNIEKFSVPLVRIDRIKI